MLCKLTVSLIQYNFILPVFFNACFKIVALNDTGNASEVFVSN